MSGGEEPHDFILGVTELGHGLRDKPWHPEGEPHDCIVGVTEFDGGLGDGDDDAGA